MRHEPKLLLEDIRIAANDIQSFTKGRSIVIIKAIDFCAGVERLFIIIGEALTRLDKLNAGMATRITDCRKIIGFRNVLVHGYETIDDAIVWQTVTNHIPILVREVSGLLAEQLQQSETKGG